MLARHAAQQAVRGDPWRRYESAKAYVQRRAETAADYEATMKIVADLLNL